MQLKVQLNQSLSQSPASTLLGFSPKRSASMETLYDPFLFLFSFEQQRWSWWQWSTRSIDRKEFFLGQMDLRAYVCAVFSSKIAHSWVFWLWVWWTLFATGIFVVERTGDVGSFYDPATCAIDLEAIADICAKYPTVRSAAVVRIESKPLRLSNSIERMQYSIVGWYRARKSAPLTPSLREASVSRNLCSAVDLEKCVLLLSQHTYETDDPFHSIMTEPYFIYREPGEGSR